MKPEPWLAQDESTKIKKGEAPMPDKIYCLMTVNGSLNSEDRNLLFHTARRMYQKNQGRKTIRTSNREGLVTTQGEFARLGSTTGMRFSAVLESERGKVRVDYIVRLCHLEPEEMEEAIWGCIPDDVFQELTAVGLN